jgi:hypothetical protein
MIEGMDPHLGDDEADDEAEAHTDEATARRVLAMAEAEDDEGLRSAAENIGPAIEWFIDNDRAAAARLSGALSGYWIHEGRVAEGDAFAERVADATIAEAARDPEIARVVPRALVAASELAYRTGDDARAAKRARDAVRAAMLIEDRATAARAYTDLAQIAHRSGDAAESERTARTAIEMAGESADADPLTVSRALHMHALAARAAGDLDEAERRFERSLDYRRRNRTPLAVAMDLDNLADIALERGDLGRAARLLTDAVEIGQKTGSPYVLANALPSVSVLAVRAGMDEASARLAGASRAIEQTAGLTPDPNSSMDDAVDTARERLGEARYAELLAEGTMLTSDDAMALALDVTRRVQQ